MGRKTVGIFPPTKKNISSCDAGARTTGKAACPRRGEVEGTDERLQLGSAVCGLWRLKQRRRPGSLGAEGTRAPAGLPAARRTLGASGLAGPEPTASWFSEAAAGHREGGRWRGSSPAPTEARCSAHPGSRGSTPVFLEGMLKRENFPDLAKVPAGARMGGSLPSSSPPLHGRQFA